MNHPTTWR